MRYCAWRTAVGSGAGNSEGLEAPLPPQQGLLKGCQRSAGKISFRVDLWKCREQWVTLVLALTPGNAVALEPELACAPSASRWQSRLRDCPWAQKAVAPALGRGLYLSPFSAGGCRSCAGQHSGILSRWRCPGSWRKQSSVRWIWVAARHLSSPGTGPPVAGCPPQHRLSLRVGCGAGACACV